VGVCVEEKGKARSVGEQSSAWICPECGRAFVHRDSLRPLRKRDFDGRSVRGFNFDLKLGLSAVLVWKYLSGRSFG
jgi:hypothetical protein